MFYTLNFFIVHKINCKVVSIGNLTLGGTGKTPMVIFLAVLFKNLDKKVDRLEMMINEVHGMVESMTQRRTDQLIGWGTGIIAALIGTIGWLVVTYVVG